MEKVTDLINVLVFEDYTTEELMRILKRKLEDEHLVMNPSSMDYLLVSEFIYFSFLYMDESTIC